MNSQSQAQGMPLCPHLAAAVLWMTKPASTPVRKGKPRRAGPVRPPMDDLAAL